MCYVRYYDMSSSLWAGWGIGAWVCLVVHYGPKVRSFGQWAAANCAVLPTANAGQYATSHCKPQLFWFRCERRYMNAPLSLYMAID